MVASQSFPIEAALKERFVGGSQETCLQRPQTCSQVDSVAQDVSSKTTRTSVQISWPQNREVSCTGQEDPIEDAGRDDSEDIRKVPGLETDQKTTTIATKVEKKPSYTPPTPSELRSRRGIFSSGSESSRRLTVSDALRSRATSGARGRKDTGIVQNIVALPKRAWNAVRIPNVGRRLKRHAKNNWKKYLLFLVAFVAVSVAYHFSRELARSVEHLRTQVADALEESKKAFGDVIKRVSRKVDEWTESSNKSQSKASFTTHEHHHHHHEHVHAPSSPPPKAPRQPAVTPQPLDDAI
ncbi:hypothetical protein AAVH_25404 [Aphelenchoides avenae]|nr:hypothetical protein AAVH_25404 [Aphelenchus avenae]